MQTRWTGGAEEKRFLLEEQWVGGGRVLLQVRFEWGESCCEHRNSTLKLLAELNNTWLLSEEWGVRSGQASI